MHISVIDFSINLNAQDCRTCCLEKSNFSFINKLKLIFDHIQDSYKDEVLTLVAKVIINLNCNVYM